MSEWQPIESASGDTCLVRAGGATIIATRIGEKSSKWVAFIPGEPLIFQPVLRIQPTHWMPLPAPPKATTP